jgi:type II secretory pathway component PulF
MNLWRILRTDLRALLRGKTAGTKPEQRPAPSQVSVHYRRRQRWRDLGLVTNQLLVIVQANLPLGEGLEAAVHDAPTHPLKRTFASLESLMGSGLSLSQAMRRRARFYPGFYIDLIEAGEQTGQLEQSLLQLRDILKQIAGLRTRAKDYAVYIGFLWMCAIAMSAYMGAFVLPMFGETMKEFGVPFSSSYLIALNGSQAVSALFRQPESLLLILGALVGALVFLAVLSQLLRQGGRTGRVLGAILLRIPVLRRLSSRRSLAHASLVLEKLLQARVPLDEALEVAGDMDINPVYAAALDRAAERVRAGHTLQEALEPEDSLPWTFRGVLAAGEGAGRLPETVGRIGRLYRREVTKLERILLDVLSPIGVVAAGCLVLVAFMAVFGTLVSIADGLATL